MPVYGYSFNNYWSNWKHGWYVFKPIGFFFDYSKGTWECYITLMNFELNIFYK